MSIGFKWIFGNPNFPICLYDILIVFGKLYWHCVSKRVTICNHNEVPFPFLCRGLSFFADSKKYVNLVLFWEYWKKWRSFFVLKTFLCQIGDSEIEICDYKWIYFSIRNLSFLVLRVAENQVLYDVNGIQIWIKTNVSELTWNLSWELRIIHKDKTTESNQTWAKFLFEAMTS